MVFVNYICILFSFFILCCRLHPTFSCCCEKCKMCASASPPRASASYQQNSLRNPSLTTFCSRWRLGSRTLPLPNPIWTPDPSLEPHPSLPVDRRLHIYPIKGKEEGDSSKVRQTPASLLKMMFPYQFHILDLLPIQQAQAKWWVF